MKLFRHPNCRAAAFACLLSPVAALAQQPAPSNFDAVAKHLQTGGVFYTLVDIDGDLARFAGFGDGLLELGKKQAGGALPPGLSASGILRSLGLDRLKAFGMSSKAASGNLYHNRALLYLPEGRSGIFKLGGGAAAPLQSPGLVPAGSDVVLESELTLSALLEIAESLLTSLGDDQYLQQYKGALGFPVPGLEMTVGDLMAQLNTRIIVAGRLEPDKSFNPPGEKVTLPGFRLVISFDQLDFLAAPLLTYAKISPEASVESGDGFSIIRPKKLPDDVPSFLQPLFYHDVKSKRLLFGSHPDAIKEFLANKTPLARDPAFVKAIAGLPVEGNEMSYFTPALYEAFDRLLKMAMKSAPVTPGSPDKEMMELMSGLMEHLSPAPNQPMVSVRANLPEGILFASNNTQSFKSLLPAGAAVPIALVSAVGFAGYSRTMEAARQMQASPAAKDDAASGADDDSGKAVQNNLQQIAFAAQSYFVDHVDATEVSYEQLIEAELLFRLEPVSGESYKGLKLKKAGGTLTVKVSGGGTVTQKYGPVTD